MKYIVDTVPQDPKDCDFAEWKPYPSFIEKHGRYLCKLDKQVCTMEEEKHIHWNSCRHLKEL